MPASNMKLVTSAVALETLGADFRYKTELYINGVRQSDGKLVGDLVIKGYGDSTLTTQDLKEFVSAIERLKIKKITGNILVDDSYFDEQRLGWGWCWEDEPYYYSAQVGALGMNRNVIDVRVKPGKAAGQPVVVTLDPPTSYLQVECSAVTGPAGSKSTLDISRAHGKNITLITGSLPFSEGPAMEAITVEDPASYVGEVFMGLLREHGITVVGKTRRFKKPINAKLIATHQSEPLSRILAVMNKPSDNLMAECLLKTAGASIGIPGSISRGEEVTINMIKKSGADPDQLRMSDGSGLSRLDIVSPYNLVTLLRYMAGTPDGKIYRDSLPIAGVDGSLQYRMKGTKAENNVYGKTGYVLHACNISGYANTQSGETLAFSLLVNHYSCSKKQVQDIQDQFCQILAEMP